MKPKVEKITLPLLGLKQDFSAAQISDLHIGGLIQQKEVKSIVDEILSLNPCAIFLTGDIVDTKISNIQDSLKELGRLQAPLGVYYVLGNHEFFHGVYEILAKMKNLGFCVLQNQCVTLKKGDEILVNLVGINDLFGRRFGDLKPDLSKALQNRDESKPTILLTHQPKFIKEIQEQDDIDLVLSGHTHGGQIFPFGILVRLDQPYLAGLYTHNEKTKIYVNRRSGFWGPPMRVGAQAEIAYFEFKAQ